MKPLRPIAAPAFAVFALVLFSVAEPALAVKNTGNAAFQEGIENNNLQCHLSGHILAHPISAKTWELFS